jgi:hypothetical protein
LIVAINAWDGCISQAFCTYGSQWTVGAKATLPAVTRTIIY